MRRVQQILMELDRLVRDERLMSAPVLREAVQATAALLAALAGGASPTAFRAAALLGRALERLGRGVWPLTDDVRAFLGECIRAITAEVEAQRLDVEIATDKAPEDAEAHSGTAAEPLFLVTVDDGDVLIDDGGEAPRPQVGRQSPRDPASSPVGSNDGIAAAGADGVAYCRSEDAYHSARQPAALVLTADGTDYLTDCPVVAGVSTIGAEELAAYKARIHDLCFRGAPKAIEILIGIVRSGAHHELRALAAAYLGALRSPEGGEILADALCDESPAVRSATLGALVRFGGGIAELAIARAATDEDGWVRFEAQLWGTRLARVSVAPACPMLSSTGLCDRPGACAAPDCDWETAGRGDFRACPRWRIE